MLHYEQWCLFKICSNLQTYLQTDRSKDVKDLKNYFHPQTHFGGLEVWQVGIFKDKDNMLIPLTLKASSESYNTFFGHCTSSRMMHA